MKIKKELSNPFKPYSIYNLDLIIDDIIKIYGVITSNSGNLNQIHLCESRCFFNKYNFDNPKLKCEYEETQIKIIIHISSRISSDNKMDIFKNKYLLAFKIYLFFKFKK